VREKDDWGSAIDSIDRLNFHDPLRFIESQEPQYGAEDTDVLYRA
jgi:hypothetical protein